MCREVLQLVCLGFVFVPYSLTAQEPEDQYAEWVKENNRLQVQLNSFYMLGKNPYMQEELEMTEKQKSEINKANSEVQKKYLEFLKAFNSEKASISQKEFKHIYMKRQVEFRRKLVKDIEGIFLKHQLKRVRQIWKQQALWRPFDVETSPLQSLMNRIHLPLKLAKELGLDEEDQKKYRAEMDKIKKDTQEKIERLYDRAVQDALSKLSPSQREKLKEQIGEFYDFTLSTSKLMEHARKAAREKLPKQKSKAESKKEEKAKTN